MIPMMKYQWFDVAGVYLIDNGMSIGNSQLLTLHTSDRFTPITYIQAEQVSIAFSSITTLRIIWQAGQPIEHGSLIYNGAFLIVEGC